MNDSEILKILPGKKWKQVKEKNNDESKECSMTFFDKRNDMPADIIFCVDNIEKHGNYKIEDHKLIINTTEGDTMEYDINLIQQDQWYYRLTLNNKIYTSDVNR